MPLYSNYLTNAVFYLDKIGVTDVVIPFLLVFTVVFMAMQRLNLVSAPGSKKKFSLVIALALSLGVVISHVTQNFRYTSGLDVVNVINSAIPRVSVVLIASLFFLILIGSFGLDVQEGQNGFKGLLFLLSLVTVGYIFLASAGVFPRGPGTLLYRIGPDTTALIVVLLIFGAIVYYITKEDSTSTTPGSGVTGLLDSLGTYIGKKGGGSQ